MRGEDQRQSEMFSYVSPEKRVPKDHPLRRIRKLVDQALEELSPRFEGLCARTVGLRSRPQAALPRAPRAARGAALNGGPLSE
jgi:hypothetical protein